MAAVDTAKLLASLELQDKFTPTAKKVIGGIDQMDKGFSRLGATASRGLNTAVTNITRLGMVAAGGLALMVKQGIGNLEKLESAEAAVTGALSQMGMAGSVTAGQVATWANQIEASVGAAFDDKAIVSASATLIRYGKVTADNLEPAMVVMTDLAAKTGDVESAATLLAKALADPEKAAGKLARSGVILTKVQQDQIKAMVKAGDAAGAQAFLLRELEKTTKGAAAASQGPYKRAMNLLADATEDAQKALAEGFLPVIEKVATWMSTKLADPRVIADIRSLGVSLAGSFDKALTFAGQIPWDSIKDAMSLAGQGAKAAFDLFTGLPPWVQTAVVTGWGLNKLTGGALGSIIGQLGSGLIKGVLGMNAGVVNINAGVVNGAGGLPGAAGAGAAAGAASIWSKVGTVIGGAFAITAVAAIADAIYPAISPGGGYQNRVTTGQDTLPADQLSWPWGPKNTPKWIIDSPFGQINVLGGDSGVPGPGSSGGGSWATPRLPDDARAIAAAKATAGKPSLPHNLVLTLNAIGPGAVGVYERAIAKGLHPTMKDVAGTLAKNVAAAKAVAAASAKAAAAAEATNAAVFAGAEKTRLGLAAVQAAINAKQFTTQIDWYNQPPAPTPVTVNVTTPRPTVSARQSIDAAVLSRRWGGDQKN